MPALTELRKLRTSKSLTYEDIAKEVGISTAGYWQIENGKRSGTYSTMVKIARVFGKTPDDIFLPRELTKG